MTPLPAPAELIYAIGMAAVAVNAASAVLETEDKKMDLVGAVVVAVPTGVLADDGNVGLAVYFLVLVPLGIAKFGTTIGHAMFDLAVASVRGPRTRALTASLRYLTMLGPLFLGIILQGFAQRTEAPALDYLASGLTVLGVLYPLVDLARAALTTADACTLWDRAAGTRVRYRVRGTVVINGGGPGGATSSPSLR